MVGGCLCARADVTFVVFNSAMGNSYFSSVWKIFFHGREKFAFAVEASVSHIFEVLFFVVFAGFYNAQIPVALCGYTNGLQQLFARDGRGVSNEHNGIVTKDFMGAGGEVGGVDSA